MQKTSKLSRDGAVWGLLMVAPTIIGLLVLNIWPFIETIYMSFSKSLLLVNLSLRAWIIISRCSRTPNSGKPPATRSCSVS